MGQSAAILHARDPVSALLVEDKFSTVLIFTESRLSPLLNTVQLVYRYIVHSVTHHRKARVLTSMLVAGNSIAWSELGRWGVGVSLWFYKQQEIKPSEVAGCPSRGT